MHRICIPIKKKANWNWEAEELSRDFSSCVILKREKVDFKPYHAISSLENTSDFQLSQWRGHKL